MNEKNENRKKPSIKEIADRTGFSPATVSLVLNRKGSFSDETKHLIRQAYAELSHDRALAEGRLFIRVLIEQYASFENDPYYSEIIQGIEKECSLLGYEMVLTFVREGYDSRAWLNQVGGLIALGGGLITDALVGELRQSEIPLVLVDNYTYKGDVLSVHSDHYGAGFLATEYLIGRGHRRIGFISGPVKYKSLVDRYAGYCAALMAHGMPLDPRYVTPNFDDSYIKGYKEMNYLLELPERPTGVFAVSDRAAFGALQAMNEAGLTNEEPIELIGCDNIGGSQGMAEKIATVNIPRFEVGQMSVRFLVEAVKGNTLVGKVVIPGTLALPVEE
jgi:DNA-binding LacI/PurR family transcriptional regulator